MAEREALQAALELYRNPMLAKSAQRMPLPKNVLQVIRIAAGEALDAGTIETTFGWSAHEVRSAAVLYLQQVLFDKHSSDHRLLGLSPGATEAEIKNHKRALLKWLHPDRNANTWESVFFQRVVQASENISAIVNCSEVGSLDHTGTANSTLPSQLHKRHRKRSHRVIANMRVRKPKYWREHLVSFLKRMSLTTIALILMFAGFKTISGSERPLNIYAIAQDMFTWVD